MNKELQFIFARRSIRKYTDKPVSKETEKALLEAAMAAPSACAKDPWRFVVIRNKGMLKKIAEGLPNGKILGDASLGILVCGDINKAHSEELSYLLQDCSAAIENILLAASALGLGACWLGVHPREERGDLIKKLLGLPGNILPVSIISIGYPAEEKESRSRYVESFVYQENWK